MFGTALSENFGAQTWKTRARKFCIVFQQHPMCQCRNGSEGVHICAGRLPKCCGCPSGWSNKQMLQNHIVRIVPDSGHERCSGGNGIGNGNLDGARTGVDQILQSEQFCSKHPTGALYATRRTHLSNLLRTSF